MKANIKNYILQLVAQHDGKLSWYQIDRALSHLDLGIIGPFHDELKELATEGLLEMKPSDLPGHVRYWITEKGQETVIHEKEL